MRRIASMTVMCLVLGCLPAAAAADRFEADLAGHEEVPVPVVSMTSGKALVRFNALRTAAVARLDIKQGERVTQAHIHCAPRGTNGPVVVFLAGLHDRGWDVHGLWTQVTFTDANVLATDGSGACPVVIENLMDLAQAAEDGLLYVNVHSVENPGGEVRGQLVPGDDGRGGEDPGSGARPGRRGR
jgi:hypothetical protein